ncbi:hypothetical protein GCM10009759_54990 [Kitasatospora saccharophila]|uniref:Regulatory LuxR family protein n=1 Tax=Kitasatospora saccharophila TaxID=407973 RepID=A0ABN2XJI8_9ACTN
MTPDLAAPQLVTTEAIELYTRMLDNTPPDLPQDGGTLGELLNLGLIREDRHTGYSVVDPSSVVARSTADLYRQASSAIDQATERLRLAAEVGEQFGGLQQAFLSHPRAAGGGIEYLRGTGAINARLVTLLDSATSEIISCQPGGPRSQKARAISAARDTETLARGVAMRVLYEEAARGGDGMDAWVEEMTGRGSQFRTLNEPFSRLIVIDRLIAVIPGDDLIDSSEEAIAYVVHDPGVAGWVAQQVDRVWARAEPWGGPRPQAVISDRGRLILAGLADGDTHGAIAARLGVSRQLVDAEVARLKVALGVTTQFGLGMRWAAMQQGTES